MVNVKITIQYDGSNFSGFQIQPEGIRTVQGEISKAISSIYDNNIITIYGSGRTDSGVHALGACANFKLPYLKMPKDKIHFALNHHLPRDIRVTHSEIVDEDFNARASCKAREYIYFIHNGIVFSPFFDKYAWFYRKNIIDEKLITEYGNVILGEHDFTSFCATSDENDSKVRLIEKAYCIRQNDNLYFIIKGNAFLHNMVRIIVGTFVEAQNRKCPPSLIKQILNSKDRKNALITAPAHGLYFRRAIF